MARSRTRLVVLLAILVLAASWPLASQDLQTVVLADDGTELATDVYLPFGAGPWPTILIRTPYGKSGNGFEGSILSLLGYACVVQDTRGRFDSGGTDTVFRDDGRDGHATLRWIVEQGWSDGTVCTYGGSAVGITQYALAPAAGPALVCQAPVVATPDLYHHAFFQGGAVRESLVHNWLAGQGSLDFLDQLLEHRLYADWWEPGDILARAGQVGAAGLHIGGWYDIFGQGSIDAFTTFQRDGGSGARNSQYLVMGPWTHATLGSRQAGELVYPPEAAVDLVGLILAWYEYWLKDGDNEVSSWPAVSVYLMGAAAEDDAPGNRWVALAGWPPAARQRELYLAAAGELVATPPGHGELELLADPDHPVPTLGGANLFPDLEVAGRPMGAGPYDQRDVEAREDVLVFTTDELAEPVTVMGRVRCRLWIIPDTPDVDLAVRLTDVYPDGRSMLVLDGIQRARHRCGDEVECLLTPGVAAELTVDLWSTAMVFNAGHRIRVDVSGSNAPRFEVNLNHGGDLNGDEPGVVARPRLLFGPDYPSRLMLPVPVAPRRAAGRLN